MAAKSKVAKRANRRNPREDRIQEDNILDFNKRQHLNKYRDESEHDTYTPNQKVRIIPRNLSQEKYLEALENEERCIIFAMGPAGTGKSLLGTHYAIKQLQTGNIKKIIITRPAVSVDEQHGYLPGTLIEKMAPWVIPIMDIFKEVYPVKVVEHMLQNEIIEVAPLAYMRGRSIKDSFIIADEMQNATPSQMKMLLTRIGNNSRMVITGDLEQHDRGYESNGLKDFIERLTNKTKSSYIEVCKFNLSDVERHPVIEDVLNIYKDLP